MQLKGNPIDPMHPAYLNLPEAELRHRVVAARELSAHCLLCPRECRADRVHGEPGTCGVGTAPIISSVGLHFGEEPPISGVQGSGTIFFSGCNLSCLFCQNYPISHLREGDQFSAQKLAAAMLRLQEGGAHNINLVTPSHVIWPILESLDIAVKLGLRLPIVYNSSGYDSIRALELLDSVVDIYMPDLKYGSDEDAVRCSGAERYWEIATTALTEMNRQVGTLACGPDGVAQRGLLIRHLVLPGNLSGTDRVLAFIAEKLGTQTAVSLMAQYHPCHQAFENPPLNRRVSPGEWTAAVESYRRLDFPGGWVQGGYR